MASQKVKGLTIKLGADTTAIESALSDVNKSLNSTSKELKSVDKLLKLDPTNINLLTQKQNLLTKSIEDTTKKLEKLREVKELADKEGIDKNDAGYRDLERQIAGAEQQLVSYTNQLEATNTQLDEGSGKALEFGDILKANIISDAVIGGVRLLADAFKQLGKELVSIITDSASYADEVNTLAKQYNLSTKEVQQYMKASELIDVDINTIAKSMSKLTKNMTSTSTGVVDAFKKLGIETKNTDGSLRDSNEVFNETIEALGKIENETEQDSVAMEIFGKSASDLGPLINGGAEQLKDFNKYLEENNLLLSQEELDNLNSLQDSFDILGGTVEAIKEKIGAELAPVITPIIDEITQFLIDHKDEVVEWVEHIVDYLTSDEAKEMYQKIKETIEKTIEGIGNFLSDWPNIKKDLEEALALFKFIYEVVDGILSTIKEIVDYVNNNEFLQSGKLGGASNSGYGFENGMGYSLVGSGGYGALNSLGYGALQSGGNNITLNASFVSNGALDEASAMRYADIITERINENLGRMV